MYETAPDIANAVIKESAYESNHKDSSLEVT